MQVKVPAHHDIIQRRHPFEQGNVLKGSCDPQGCNMVGRHGCPLFSLKKDAALIGRVKSVDDVQQGCLAGAVWSDDGHDFSGIDLHVDPVEGFQPSKANVYIFHF